MKINSIKSRLVFVVFTVLIMLLSAIGLAACDTLGNNDNENGNNNDTELTSITLNTDSVQKVFTVGDEFTSEGLIVTAHYSDNTSEEVTDYTVEEPDMSTSGAKDVVVTYENKQAQYNISVNEQQGQPPVTEPDDPDEPDEPDEPEAVTVNLISSDGKTASFEVDEGDTLSLQQIADELGIDVNDIEGVYTDTDYTQKFDISTAINETRTIYVKLVEVEEFVPYTLIFDVVTESAYESGDSPVAGVGSFAITKDGQKVTGDEFIAVEGVNFTNYKSGSTKSNEYGTSYSDYSEIKTSRGVMVTVAKGAPKVTITAYVSHTTSDKTRNAYIGTVRGNDGNFSTSEGILKTLGVTSNGLQSLTATDLSEGIYYIYAGSDTVHLYAIEINIGGNSGSTGGGTNNPEEPADPPVIDSDNTLTVTAAGGYEEGAYVELAFESGTTASDYTVMYQASGSSSWTAIDKELIRVSGNTVRADIVGIKAGTYSIKVEAKSKSATVSNVTVKAYDRSGFAHFNATAGVGGYNNDGTPKSNAIIVYVDENNKNTVTADGISGTGIVEIIKNSGNQSKPLIVRIIGRITAATWNQIVYSSYESGNVSSVKGANGKNLPTSTTTSGTSSTYYYITEDMIISGGYNTLNETNGITKLNNLTNRINYTVPTSDKKAEYDSYYNMCDVNGANNVTVEGIGTDAEIFQWGFTWKKCNSIEVRNLTFDDYTEDACSFEGDQSQTVIDKFDSQRLWVHHNTFNEGKNYWDVCPEQDKREGDGATDFKGVSYVTVSYNHYIKNHKTGLVGSGSSSMSANVTFHHNWYEECSARLPMARQANMHMYNNYYYKSGSSISVRAKAYAFVEYCYFEGGSSPITSATDGGNNGYAKIYSCEFSGVSLTTNDYIKQVTSRTASIDNNNSFNAAFGMNFDLDSTHFYYANGKTNVTYITTAAQAKTDCMAMAGVHKD